MTKVPSWFCWGLRWSRRSTTPLLLLQSLTSSFSSLSSLTLRLLHKIPSQESNSKSPVLKFIILLFSIPSSSWAYADKISTLTIQNSQNLDLDLRNQTFIFLFPYVWNPFKNILMTFETFLMMSITTERYLATRSPLQYRVGQVLLFIWFDWKVACIASFGCLGEPGVDFGLMWNNFFATFATDQPIAHFDLSLR